MTLETRLAELEVQLTEREVYISKLRNDLDMDAKFMSLLRLLYVPCFMIGFGIAWAIWG